MSDNRIVVQVDEDLEDLVPGFLENRQQDLEKLRSAVNENDFENLRSIGHSIKGVGGGYGFNLMSELGAAIEIAAKENNADTVRDKIEQLDDYLKRVDVEYV